MTKADIVDRVAEATGITKKESFDLVEAAFAEMKQVIESGENLKISGFGVFEVQQKHARKGRNPQTGEALIIAPRRILTFKPSPVLKRHINGLEPLSHVDPD
jgi:integration host factor subunit alpha